MALTWRFIVLASAFGALLRSQHFVLRAQPPCEVVSAKPVAAATRSDTSRLALRPYRVAEAQSAHVLPPRIESVRAVCSRPAPSRTSRATVDIVRFDPCVPPRIYQASTRRAPIVAAGGCTVASRDRSPLRQSLCAFAAPQK